MSRPSTSASLASLAAVLIVGACVTAASRRQPVVEPPEIEIVGSERFTRQIQAALALLREHAPDDYASVAEHVRRVEESERSGMVIERSTCQMAPESTYYSLTWCAGVIAHESLHARFAREVGHTYGLAEEERACIAYQCEVLQRIGAPQAEIDYLRTLDGSHFDVDGDGVYTWDDYHARDW